MEKSSNGANKAIIAAIVIVLLVVAATAAIVMTNSSTEDTELSANTTSSSPSPSPDVAADSSSDATVATESEIKDGTYNADGQYQTPGGLESIGVTVTLVDGVVTDASIDQEGKTGEAKEYQARFVSAFKSGVIGKKITDVSLSRVAGSSLTPIGFNNAIDDIENQANA